MRVLGIDPGMLSTGYGVVDEKDGKIELVVYGCVSPSPKKNYPLRIQYIYEKIVEVIEKYQPEEMALEEIFYSRNVKVALSLGQARGIVILAAANHKLKLYEYTALQIKQAVVGYGLAQKEQVQKMVKIILGLETLPEPTDAADALAVAISHVNSRRFENIRQTKAI